MAITVLNELLSIKCNFESTGTIHVKSSRLMLNIVIMTHKGYKHSWWPKIHLEFGSRRPYWHQSI